MTTHVMKKVPGAVYWAEFSDVLLDEPELYLHHALASVGIEIIEYGPVLEHSQFVKVHDETADDELNGRTVELTFESWHEPHYDKELGGIGSIKFRIKERRVRA